MVGKVKAVLPLARGPGEGLNPDFWPLPHTQKINKSKMRLLLHLFGIGILIPALLVACQTKTEEVEETREVEVIKEVEEQEIPDLYFNHVALSVADPAASVEFYHSVLGLEEITNRTEKEGIRWMSLGEDKEIHLISTIEGEVVMNKAVHFAVTTREFDAMVDRLKAMEIPYSDWPGEMNTVSLRADGIRQVYIQDPDGYWVEVNSAE